MLLDPRRLIKAGVYSEEAFVQGNTVLATVLWCYYLSIFIYYYRRGSIIIIIIIGVVDKENVLLINP